MIALIHQRTELLVLLTGSLLLLAGAALRLIYLRWGSRFYTQKHKARVERQELARHCESMSRYANDAIVLVDDVGRIVHANDRAAEFYGYSVVELTGMEFEELLERPGTDDFARRWKLMGELGSLVFESVHRRRNGELFPVEVSGRLFVLGGVNFRQSIIRDISERKKAEQALRESEDRFRQVVENAPDAIYINIAGRFQYLNPAAARLYGAGSPEELIGSPVLDRVHPDYREQARERSELLLSGQQDLPPMDQRWFRVDGTVFDVEVSAVAFVYRQQPGGLVFFRDVTARKRLEEQFRQAQKMESVGRLAGGVAHDFNNHLTVILGYCDLLNSRLAAQDPSRSGIEEIRKAGQAAAALTRQLLAFSRKQIIEAKPLDLNAVVKDTEKMLLRILGEDIELVTHLEEGSCQVMADAGQIVQVLLNLAVNARDAMPDGGKILIETAPAELDEQYAAGHEGEPLGSYVRLSFSDTGLGMDKETQAHIFEPFFTTKDAGKGTGLGLSTVYGIVRQSNGWLSVYSEPDKGTTFKIYLPRLDRPLEIARPVQAPPESLRGEETILLVEDQDDVRGLACMALKGCGYRVLQAGNGGEGLLVSAGYDGPIHALVTDVVMPGMSGRELAERLQKDRPETKVLYVSGYTADVIVNQGIKEQKIFFLAKPYTPATLARKVREVLGPPEATR